MYPSIFNRLRAMDGLYSRGEESMTLCSAVLIQYQRVTDRQTDRQTELVYLRRTSALLLTHVKIVAFLSLHGF